MTTLGNQRYRLERRLSAGERSGVWQARDLHAGIPVAIKRLTKRSAADHLVRARFVQEMVLTSRFDHPNVIRVLDTDPHAARPYIVEELVPGESLDQVLRRGHLPPTTAIRITGALARALGHIHGRGVVHCDVKPANILIRNDGEVKLTDFGIAIDTARPTPGVFGSIHYMSPQRVEGAVPTPQCDIYALGVTFYEMVGGRRPFTGSTPFEVALAHRRGTPAPIRALAELSPATAAIMSGMMAADPAERYASAGYVAMGLEASLAAASEADRPVAV